MEIMRSGRPVGFALTSHIEPPRTALGIVAVFLPIRPGFEHSRPPPSPPTRRGFVSAVVVFDLVSLELCPGMIRFALLGSPTCCCICRIFCRVAVSAAQAPLLVLERRDDSQDPGVSLRRN